MRQVAAVWKKEMMITFSSPVFYASAFVFLLIAGYFFYSNTAYLSLLSLQAMNNPFLSERLNFSDVIIKPFMGDLSIILLLMIPLLTMRLYAEERKTGTIELLFTYPISDWTALAGKFLATVSLLIMLLAGTLPYLAILEYFGNLEWGIVLSGYAGLLLLGGSFVALGIFTSSLTENQIVAAVLSFGALLMLWALGWATAFSGPALGRILEHLSIVRHIQPFVSGLIDSSDVVFYLLFIYVWLFLTLRFLNSRYWRK